MKTFIAVLLLCSSVAWSRVPATGTRILKIQASGMNYTKSDNIFFTVTFSKAVQVSHSPYIIVKVGCKPMIANYVSGSGTDTLVFRYEVKANDMDRNGLEILSPIQLNGGVMRDVDGKEVNPTFKAPDLKHVKVDACVTNFCVSC